MSNYGYIRVSTRDQNEYRQVIALKEYGVDTNHIYIVSLIREAYFFLWCTELV